MDDIKNEEDFIYTANKLLIRIGKEPYIKHLTQCNHKYFVDVYEALLGESLPGCTSTLDTIDGMIYNVQTVIDSLSEDVLGMDISHVSARLIVSKDKEHIQCLLEIFDGLLEYVLEELDHDRKMDLRMPHTNNREVDDYSSSDSSDSDVLDDNHEILSDVIQEEFGQSYQNRNQQLSPNLVYDKKRAAKMSNIGDCVTWKSGDISHTVAWSDTRLANALSPSGESTATDELINIAQTTGNSTDELITEAQTIQKEFELYRSTKGYNNGSQNKQTEPAVLSPPMNHWLSFMPSATSHESLASEEDIQWHQHEKLPFEKKDERKQDNKPVLSKPSYNYVSHVGVSASSVCSTTSTCSTDLKLIDMTLDSLQTTEQYDKDVATYIDSTSTKDVSDQSVESLCVKHRKKRSIIHGGDEQKSFVDDTGSTRKKKSTIRRKADMDNKGNRKKLHKRYKQNDSCGKTAHTEFNEKISLSIQDSGSEKKTVGGKRDIDNEKMLAVKNGGEDAEHFIQEDVDKSIHACPQTTDQLSLTINTEDDGTDTITLLDKQTEHDGSSCTTKVQKNLELPEPVTDVRSKQLSDLSERLHKLQKKVRPQVPVSLNIKEDTIPRQSNITGYTLPPQSNITEDLIPDQSNITKDTHPCQSNITKDTRPCQSNITDDTHPCQSNITEDTHPSCRSNITEDTHPSCRSNITEDTHPSCQSNITDDTTSRNSNVVAKEKKDKAKVSFQLDSLLDDYHYSLSDTEIDYTMSSQADTHIEDNVLRGQPHNKVGQKRNKVQKNNVTDKQTNLQKNILRTKSTQSDSTTATSANDTTLSVQTNITSQFEKQYLKRDERLRKVHEGLKAEEKENKRSVQKLSGKYSKHHGKLLNQKKMIQKQSNIQRKTQKQNEKAAVYFAPSSPRGRSFPRLKPAADNKYAAKLSAIYGKASPKKPILKGQKRSASTSPVARRRYKTPMVLEEHEILPVMEDEFPFLHLSPHTAKLMWQKQLRHVNNLSKHGRPHKTSKIQRTIDDAYRKQNALAGMMKKEIEHNRKLKELKERQDEDTVVQRNLRERRQRSARARRYYNEYAIRNKARMLKKRTKEEKIFKQLFEDGLEIQKQRINEMRSYAREQKEKNAKKQKDEIDSLENFYKDKFACLAESVAEEKYELETRQKAQSHVLNKMRSSMRNRMEKDLKDIQEQLNNDDDACFFRQLDADVLKKEFQLATYKASRLR